MTRLGIATFKDATEDMLRTAEYILSLLCLGAPPPLGRQAMQHSLLPKQLLPRSRFTLCHTRLDAVAVSKVLLTLVSYKKVLSAAPRISLSLTKLISLENIRREREMRGCDACIENYYKTQYFLVFLNEFLFSLLVQLDMNRQKGLSHIATCKINRQAEEVVVGRDYPFSIQMPDCLWIIRTEDESTIIQWMDAWRLPRLSIHRMFLHSFEAVREHALTEIRHLCTIYDYLNISGR